MKRLEWQSAFLVAIACLLGHPGQASTSVQKSELPIQINEILASNASTFPDNIDFEDYSDWIELYNPNSQPISLKDYFLTDRRGKPTRWGFFEDIKLPPNGYLVIQADGHDAVPGEPKVRTVAPWDCFTTAHFHTNFKLAASGEEVALFKHIGPAEQRVLSPLHVDWRFHDQGRSPGLGWNQPNFDDSHWSHGVGQFGYGEDDERTVLDYGEDEDNKHAAYYFRRAFNLESADRLAHLKLRLLADDGAIVYLNGKEVARVRMPDGEVDHTTYARGLAEEDVFDIIGIDPKRLRIGRNVIAVEIHQDDPDSSDLSFDLELSVTQLRGHLILVDHVEFEQQYPDVSWTRNPTDPGEWFHSGTPTPGKPNSPEAIQQLDYCNEAQFSLKGGLYQGPQQVALMSSDELGEIRYTLDGSIPGPDASLYTDPFPVTKNTTLRVRVFQQGKLPSKVTTQTFIIDEPCSSIPIISLNSDPNLLFDHKIGIYSNAYKGKEIPGNVEYFTAQGRSQFTTPIGIKIAGENIWRFPQKPLLLNVRDGFGSLPLDHTIFPGQRSAAYQQVVLRNGGDNWARAMLRDALTPLLLKGQTQSDTQAYQPCHSYLNGAYWGIYNIRERFNDAYFQRHHQITKDGYDYLKFSHVQGGSLSLVAEEGGTLAYESLLAYAETHDLSVDKFYQPFTSQIDLNSFIDYVVIESFVHNGSWSHNRELWRPRHPDGRWRWIVADLDRGFRRDKVRSFMIEEIMEDDSLFAHLCKNHTFRNQLLQRYSAHLSSTLHPQRISDLVDQVNHALEPEIARHIRRWSDQGGITSTQSRNTELQEIKFFTEERRGYIRAELDALFPQFGTINLTVTTSPAHAGRVRIQGVPLLPNYSRSAEVYRDMPVSIEVESQPGFQFVGWNQPISPSGSIRTRFSKDTELVAVFKRSSETILPLVISQDTHLKAADSPYMIIESLEIASDATLIIDAGVELTMGPNADVIVQGTLESRGTSQDPVSIHARRSDDTWGAIVFLNPETKSRIAHTNIRNGSVGQNPKYWKAALSNIGSNLTIEHSTIENSSTLYALGGQTIVRSCTIHAPISGDGINVEAGVGEVENCTLVGNLSPDCDGIDFDGVQDGVIRSNRIRGFLGPNSDGIDIGEASSNLEISGNQIIDCSDKGISVGQGSTAIITDNLISGCHFGVGVKDSDSHATINSVRFVNNHIGIGVFQKNLLRGGGTAKIAGSTFMNTRESAVYSDEYSQLSIQSSLSNNGGTQSMWKRVLASNAGPSAGERWPLSPGTRGLSPYSRFRGLVGH